MLPNFDKPEIDILEGFGLGIEPPIVETADPAAVVIPTAGGRPIILSRAALSRHVCIVGGTGQGKTELVKHIFHSDRRSAAKVVLDVKGSFRREFGSDRDLVINDDRFSSDPNPWSLPREIAFDREHSSTGSLSQALISEISNTIFDQDLERSMQIIFPMAAAQVFGGSVYHVAQDSKASNADVLKFWAQPLNEIIKIFRKDPRTAGLVQHIEQNDPQTRGVLFHVRKVLEELFVDRWAEPGTLSIREEICRSRAEGRTIFLEYRVSEGKALSPIFRAIVDLALKQALALGEHDLAAKGKTDRTVYFFLDEISLLPRLSHLIQALNFGRELGLCVVLGLQTTGDQLRQSYGPEADSIAPACANLFTFWLSDGATREHVKTLFGQNRKRLALWSKYSAGGIQESNSVGNAVEDWDLLSLNVGECIGRIFGHPQPFRSQILRFKPDFRSGPPLTGQVAAKPRRT